MHPKMQLWADFSFQRSEMWPLSTACDEYGLCGHTKPRCYAPSIRVWVSQPFAPGWGPSDLVLGQGDSVSKVPAGLEPQSNGKSRSSCRGNTPLQGKSPITMANPLGRTDFLSGGFPNRYGWDAILALTFRDWASFIWLESFQFQFGIDFYPVDTTFS